MKKLQLVVVGAAMAAIGFCGCKTNVAPPEIKFSDSPAAAVAAGDSKEIAFAVKTTGKLKKVTFFCKNADGEEELVGTPVVKFPTKDKYEGVYKLTDITTCVIFVVEAVDAKNQTSRAEYVITLADSAATTTAASAGAEPAPAVKTDAPAYSGDGIELGFNKNSSVGSSFRVKKNKVADLYWAMQYANSVDFMFFYGKTNGVTIVAPSDEYAAAVFNNEGCGVALWETRNSTTLVKSALSFDSATLAEVETEVNAAASTSVNQLKQGDVVAFKTAGGQIGLVRLAHAGDSNTSTLNINVKVLN